MKDFTATIIDVNHSERAEAWRNVLGTNEAILKHPFPFLAQNFHLTEEEVAADLDNVGCPILAEDVVVTIHNPQKWL